MTKINWMEEVKKREAEIIEQTQQFLRIKSVLEERAGENAPFGEGIQQALEFLLNKGEKDGFQVKNVDGYAGHIEMGQGDDLVGVLCHVDVVPEGDGWSVEPYGAEIKDGKIFARGAIDDKGPTMAAYYAMKIVNDLELPINKRIRMIIGTDEESNWRCVDHYFEHEEMPTMGFAPDADFPLIYAEKGIADFDLVQAPTEISTTKTTILKELRSGRRYNMVPDFAQATIEHHEEENQLKSAFEKFLQDKQVSGSVSSEGNLMVLELTGVSAHGSVPQKGKNAGLLLSEFLHTQHLDDQAQQFIKYVQNYFVEDCTGDKLGVSYSDEITGSLTMNVGILSYTSDNGGKLGVNMRYPVTANSESIMSIIKEKNEPYGIKVEHFSNSKPHHVDKNHHLVKTLQHVYSAQTGEEATLLSIGGGTYARALEAGVAFGPLFPGREEVAHEKDEYMYIEDLLKATAIYAQALYELTK
ncbi:dipeptidase PepV [Metabacillus iocasae]|uniref:Succinyl-diaminopimelate desuccinylase n=1 Tax=Priestia iocasae TaxID=2291674 RepID=A0ABS2QZF2_9BACI|nr:dipeptidase PepV [Metabacillus iocasae]MBM7704864.1 succinyl-diaminopimelate desuccinylase [Metabacillus iocasae]